MEKNYFESEKYKQAQKNWKENGYLGVTSDDHLGIYSTPNEKLQENPGKTLADLMSDQEILDYISGTKKNILENEGMEKLKEYNTSLKENLETTINYLKKIGRLPEDWE
jgi:hypothetical protein